MDAFVDPQWLWKDRRVYLYDGSTVSMPDTQENRKEYPLTYNQKPGTGFPVARIGALISLSCGGILDLGICRYAGKGQSELGMLHKLWGLFRSGDVLVADRLMCAWTEMVMLQQRGIDCVFRLTSHRTADFRRGTRLGKDDHIVTWKKPAKPRSVDRTFYDTLPDFLVVRECRIQIKQPGFRVRSLIIATTLLDAEEYTIKDLTQLYRARWNIELEWRFLKGIVHIDVLRCKTPDLVRKDIWMHVLAYNLIHTVMAQAASENEISPRSISFKATLQFLEAFQPVIASQAHWGRQHRESLYQEMLRAIARHRVADRPDRFEPRMAKRRPKNHDRLTKPRKQLKLEILERLSKSKCHSSIRPKLAFRKMGFDGDHQSDGRFLEIRAPTFVVSIQMYNQSGPADSLRLSTIPTPCAQAPKRSRGPPGQGNSVLPYWSAFRPLSGGLSHDSRLGPVSQRRTVRVVIPRSAAMS